VPGSMLSVTTSTPKLMDDIIPADTFALTRPRRVSFAEQPESASRSEKRVEGAGVCAGWRRCRSQCTRRDVSS